MLMTLIKRELWERRVEFVWVPLVLLVLGLLPSLYVLTSLNDFDFNRTVVINLGGDDASDMPLPPEPPMAPGEELILTPDTSTPLNWDFHQQWLQAGEASGLGEHTLAQLDGGITSDDGTTLNSISHGMFIVFYVVWFVVAYLYLLDGLYRERRDRSLLFWQSMPVPEWQVVLAKLVTPWLLLVLVYWLASWIPQWLLVATLAAKDTLGLTAAGDYQPLVTLLAQSKVVATVMLSSLPLACWLLLVSSRATKLPLLWALLIPAALEVIFFWLLGLGSVLEFVRWTLPHVEFSDGHLYVPAQPWWTWLAGAVLSVACFVGAVYFRRRSY
jgi:ABC-2 type transport system permease protein